MTNAEPMPERNDPLSPREFFDAAMTGSEMNGGFEALKYSHDEDNARKFFDGYVSSLGEDEKYVGSSLEELRYIAAEKIRFAAPFYVFDINILGKEDEIRSILGVYTSIFDALEQEK